MRNSPEIILVATGLCRRVAMPLCLMVGSYRVKSPPKFFRIKRSLFVPLSFAFNQNRKLQPNTMCRNIKTLHNFTPPATEEEIRASSIQFVRKLSGFTKPSKANELAFNRAVDQVAETAR